MLSWFKKKLGAAQDLQSAQGAEASEVVTPVAAVDLVEAAGQPQENGLGFFLRLKEGLSRTRKTFVRQIDALFLGKKEIDAELLENLEEILSVEGIDASMIGPYDLSGSLGYPGEFDRPDVKK